jgi:hypothetical protein
VEVALDVSSLLLAGLIAAQAPTPPSQNETAALRQQFYEHSGARLVFEESELPHGRYHDHMLPLEQDRRLEAARIALEQIKHYPVGYLGDIGLQAVGLFGACVGDTSDGFRPYEPDLGGYRYYGMWTSGGGIAAAYYDDGQLPLTLHHEIFHQVDSAHEGHLQYERWYNEDDLKFAARIHGVAPLLPPDIDLDQLTALRARSRGVVLTDVVSPYTQKSPGEDQAETAWHLQMHLADSLVQVMERPELPGSQRLLHVLAAYDEAHPQGPGIGWWVDQALAKSPIVLASVRPQNHLAR